MKNKDIIGPLLIALLFVFLIIVGIISYRSIDWEVLQKLEGNKLILPTPIVKTNQISTPSTISTPSANK